ncbi:NEDD8 protease Nep2 [Schizosaccharomyces pombe]|uniref:NEDD8-specific protease 2 n=1 Tax=Schizosaccharomyces pombe (strain 972 / ATCC 24843) TaxID=284812 RepID=NEP2_SCHPO|nr:NEDD8 protease Nep2 [Schizosaccharomyces pombe]O13612.1 RecName: Full=NEDD8-specific protease 2; AltName: Full=Meiotically up-regulated gene 120 protein [Schizosaccharomyces pombe 972h-]BAA21400.1 pi021 [Schizosaccharomyces pombe]CAC37492.1 NEDD8 protease Nep2 [Schizosaccharomyces pombe]|eukprot:NP_595608.1 NEDD8 protease Nep2 [Schizosaccharomyces pombe]
MRSNSIFTKEIDSEAVKKSSNLRPPSTGSSNSNGSDTASPKKKKKGFFRSLFGSSSSGSKSCGSPFTRIWLEYFEVSLRKNDVDHFRPGYWILDTNIDFFYEIMLRQVLLKRPKEESQQIYLLRPAMVFFLAQAPNPLEIESALPPAMFDASFIFLPINDTNECGIESGSHWSLLVVSVEKGLGWYYDSMSNGNTNDCNLAIKNLGILLKKEFRVRHMKTPQQINDCDCGLHVCENTRILMYRLLQKPYVPKVDMNLDHSVVDSVRLRKALMEVITSLLAAYGSKVPKPSETHTDPEKDKKIFSKICKTEELLELPTLSAVTSDSAQPHSLPASMPSSQPQSRSESLPLTHPNSEPNPKLDSQPNSSPVRRPSLIKVKTASTSVLPTSILQRPPSIVPRPETAAIQHTQQSIEIH